MTELSVHFSVEGERSVLRLTGELDLESVSELRLHAEAELAAGRCQGLVIDLSGVTFIDSSGLGLLVELRRMAGVSGVALELANVPARVMRVIAIAGLTEVFGLPEPAGADDAPAS